MMKLEQLVTDDNSSKDGLFNIGDSEVRRLSKDDLACKLNGSGEGCFLALGRWLFEVRVGFSAGKWLFICCYERISNM